MVLYPPSVPISRTRRRPRDAHQQVEKLAQEPGHVDGGEAFFFIRLERRIQGLVAGGKLIAKIAVYL